MPEKDLSNVHQLVSDLFSLPEKKTDWEQYRLTKEQVNFLMRMVISLVSGCWIHGKSIG